MFVCPNFSPSFLSGTSDFNDINRLIWIGPSGTVSPFHTDSQQNVYAQISGYKYVQLVPSRYVEEMYPYTTVRLDNTVSELQKNRTATTNPCPYLRSNTVFIHPIKALVRERSRRSQKLTHQFNNTHHNTSHHLSLVISCYNIIPTITLSSSSSVVVLDAVKYLQYLSF